jgi:O-antigen/teichoic acid export membrane protein
MSDPSASRYHFYARVAGTTAYLAAAVGASSLGLFGIDVLLNRLLGDAAQFGLITYVVGLISIPLYLSDLGLSRALPAAIASAVARGETREANRAFGNALVLQIAAAGVLAAGVVAASYRLPEVVEAVRGVFGLDAGSVTVPEYVAPWCRVLVVWMVAMSIVRLLSGVFDGYQKMRYSFVAALLREPVRMVCIAAVGLWFVFGTGAAILVLAMSSVVALGLNVVLFRFFQRANPDCRFAFYRVGCARMFRESLYFYLPLVGLWIFPELVKVMAGTLDSPETVGRVTVCLRLSTLAFVVLGALPRAMLPAFSGKAHDVVVLRASFLGLLKYAGLANFVVFAVMASGGPYLVRAIFGAAYAVQDIQAVMVLVSLGSFLEIYRLLTEPVLQATGHARAAGVVEVVRVAAFVGLGMVLIPRWPLMGVVAAFVVVNFLAWLLRFVYTHRLIVHVPWFAMVAIAGFASGAAALALAGWTLLFWLLVAAAILVQFFQFSRTEAATIRRTLATFFKRG